MRKAEKEKNTTNSKKIEKKSSRKERGKEKQREQQEKRVHENCCYTIKNL